MAKEILVVPESKLKEVIIIIRNGLFITQCLPEVSDETRNMLYKWCDEEEEYLKELSEG